MQQESGRFLTRDGISLYEHWWLPDQKPKAGFILIHGYSEHIGRYAHVAEYLAGRGYAVGGIDLRGHGHSAEKRTYIGSYQTCIEDIQEFFGRVEDRVPYQKRFIFGHSMGGAIVAKLLIQSPNCVDGAVLSGAALYISAPANPILRAGSGLLSRIAPRVPTVPPQLIELTHDPEMAAKNEADPLGLGHARITARTGYEILSHRAYFDEHMAAITTPLLILHGGADSIADPQGSRKLYEVAASEDKTLHIFDGMYHELHNEVIREQWMQIIGDWLDAHL